MSGSGDERDRPPLPKAIANLAATLAARIESAETPSPLVSVASPNPFAATLDELPREATPKPPLATTKPGPIAHDDGDEPFFPIGSDVDGFHVLSFLGVGGMGQVLEAEDRVLGRRVALKVAHPTVDRGWLRQEARALASVRHPSLLQVYGFGTFGGFDYLVLERIFGVDLRTFVERRDRAGEPIAVPDALEILLRLAEALAEIHSAGLVHFDVKPANVMLAPKGRVVLMDFGLARVEAAVERLRTMQGTPAYMAPEVIVGNVDARLAFLVDAYALGALAFELLSGAPPFESRVLVDLLGQHLAVEAPRLSSKRDDIPRKLDELVAELLAKDPLDRPPSLEAVAWRVRKLRDAGSNAAQEEAFRVLIVDADAAAADYTARIVRATAPGAVVQIANDAEAALAIVRAAPVHLLFVDLHLPHTSGVELAMYLRGGHLAARCRIVALSAGAQWADVGLLRQLGITDFVRKGELLSERLRPLVHHALDELQMRRRMGG